MDILYFFSDGKKNGNEPFEIERNEWKERNKIRRAEEVTENIMTYNCGPGNFSLAEIQEWKKEIQEITVETNDGKNGSTRCGWILYLFNRENG